MFKFPSVKLSEFRYLRPSDVWEPRQKSTNRTVKKKKKNKIKVLNTSKCIGGAKPRSLQKYGLESCYTHREWLKGLSHEIDFKNVVENGQILALIRAAAGF